VLVCFGFYNVAADVDPGAFIGAESRNAVAYRAGCRTFGWECLGNYACTGQPAGSLPFGYVHAYVIDGSDPAEALRAAEEASGPPGFAEVVAEGRSFMTSQEDTAVAWLHATGDQPDKPTPLKDRCIVVRLHNGAEPPEHIGHPGWLGRFTVEGAADAEEAEVCVHGSDDADSAHAGCNWVLTPVVTGGEAVPPLA
jgi:hypothetical protein